MKVRWRIRGSPVLFVVGLVGFSACSLASASSGEDLRGQAIPPRPAAPQFSPIQDLRLTMHVRRALSANRELAKLNLGIKVKSGVATLWGPVPSVLIGRQAMQVVLAVDGIRKVQNEMHVEHKDPPLELFARSSPTRPLPASPDRDSWALNAVTRQALESQTLTMSGPWSIQDKPPLLPANVHICRKDPVLLTHPRPTASVVAGPRLVPIPARVERQLPTMLPDAAGVVPVSTDALVLAVRRLQNQKEVFREVEVEVRGRVVVIRPGLARGEYASAFAEQVRKLDGVAEVRFEE